jgi:hypothetical protein
MTGLSQCIPAAVAANPTEMRGSRAVRATLGPSPHGGATVVGGHVVGSRFALTSRHPDPRLGWAVVAPLTCQNSHRSNAHLTDPARDEQKGRP